MGSKKPTILIVISGFIVYRVLLIVSLYCQRGVVIFTSVFQRRKMNYPAHSQTHS